MLLASKSISTLLFGEDISEPPPARDDDVGRLKVSVITEEDILSEEHEHIIVVGR